MKIISNVGASSNRYAVASSDWLVPVIGFLIFIPIPLGLGRFELNAVQPLIAMLGLIAFGFAPSKNGALLLALLTITCGIATAVEMGSTSGQEVVPFQIVRTVIFIAVGYVIYSWGERRELLFVWIQERLGFLIVPLLMQVGIAFFAPSVVNSPLGGGIEATGQRIYIYPYHFLYMLLPFLIEKRRLFLAITATILLAVTGSKQIYIFLVIAWLLCGINSRHVFRAALALGGVICVAVGALVLGVVERFEEFALVGDPTRSAEISYALEAWSRDLFSAVFGTGLGTRYWVGWDDVLRVQDADDWLVNSGYDVHNGYVGILLRAGIFGLLALALATLRIQRGIPLKLQIVILLAIGLALSSSAGHYTNDFAFYILAMLYGRNIYSQKSSADAK